MHIGHTHSSDSPTLQEHSNEARIYQMKAYSLCPPGFSHTHICWSSYVTIDLKMLVRLRSKFSELSDKYVLATTLSRPERGIL